MNSMKRQNDRILKEELPRSVGAQYATGDQWRNKPRKNEGMEPKQYPVVDVTGDRRSPVTLKLGIVFALAPSLHSFWSYFFTDLQ